MRAYALLVPLMLLAGCVEEAPASGGDRPMDEFPDQSTRADGSRVYGFDSGCVIVVEPRRAVVVSETGNCALHHRDIALLYAAGD